LSVHKHKKKISAVASSLRKKGIEVSIFIDPDQREICAVKDIGVDTIEIHTGQYCLAVAKRTIDKEYRKIKDAVGYALSLGLVVNAGHGLDYGNVENIARIKGVNELNIGHSIISRSVLTGLYEAVRDMKALLR